ncbi:MAG: hypothetical protein Q9195_005219 [Heterodermia aff. obscurata]
MPLRTVTISEEIEVNNAITRLKIAPTISAPSLGDYYHVAPVPDEGQVCLASRPIARGTRILEEAPRLSPFNSNNASNPGDLKSLVPVLALRNLTLNDVISSSTLNPELLDHALSKLTLLDLDWFESFGPGKANKRKSFHNRLHNIPAEEMHSAVFVNASQFNHSCLPNAFYTWNDNLGANPRGCLTIHAIRDIAFGEEILINYLNEDSQVSGIAQRKKLQAGYGFECNCPACDSGAPDAARVEDNRKWIQEIIRARGSGDDPTVLSRRQRYLEFVELQKLDELLETEGILYPQRARGYGWMAEWCARELSQKTVALDRQECRQLGLKAARNKLDLDIVCNGYMSSEAHKSLDLIKKLA